MLLSRLAENVYWAGRYLERAEATARLVRVQTELYLDLPRSVSVGWRPLLAVTGSDKTYAELTADDAQGVAATEEHQVVRFLTTRPDHPGSVLQCLAAARLNLRSVRALVPRAGWEVANSLHLWANETQDLAVPRRSRIEWLNGIVRRCQTLTGLLDGTMSHDQAYGFLQIGRHLERADMTTRVIDVSASILLDHRLGQGTLPYADITWMGVLKSVSAMQMYRRVARVGVHGPRALSFLLCDPEFPRSVHHALTELSRRAIDLPRNEETMRATAIAKQALIDCEMAGMSGPELHAYMDALQGALARIHDAAAATWFAVQPDGHSPAADPDAEAADRAVPEPGTQSQSQTATVG